jgi:peptidoglycan-N-acetylglucosamine deacetylase
VEARPTIRAVRRAAVLCLIFAVLPPAAALPLAEPHQGEAAPASPRWARGMPTEGVTSRRWLLLTFDDGPRPDTTPEVARTLMREGIPAVFFVNGVHMEGPNPYARRNRDLVAWLASQGFTIGNHGLTHAHLESLTAAETSREIVDNERIITEATGEVPWLFRPSYGNLSLHARDLVEARGLTLVGWNLGAADFIEQSPLGIVYTIRNKLARREKQGIFGGIVMLHDAHPWTAEALPLLIDWVRSRNCALLARDEELYEFVDFDRFYVPKRSANRRGAMELAPAPEPTIEQALQAQNRVRADAVRRCQVP